MSYIFEKLYIGDIDEALNSLNLRDNKEVTHILTVDSKPLGIEARTGFIYKYIHCLDVEEFDLLSHFDDCVKFIEEGRNAGGVLVHCYAGQSRSATIVIAFMMAKLDLSLSDALKFAKKMRSSIGPNCGFLKQLELFEKMGNHVDQSYPEYRQYRLSILASEMLNASLHHEILASSLSSDPTLTNNNGEALYKCRKCRRPLFRDSGILNHFTGPGHKAIKKQLKTKTTEIGEEVACTESMFIEPVAWMQPMILQLEGKLSCPKCGGKLGSFRWAGEQCPCGQWITPAFHLQKSKLDYCNKVVVCAQRPNIPFVINSLNDDGNPRNSKVENETDTSVEISSKTLDLSESLQSHVGLLQI